MTTSIEPQAKTKPKRSIIKTLFYIFITLSVLFLALTTYAVTLIRRGGDESKSQVALTQVCKLSQVVKFHKAKYDTYPTTDDGLQSLVTKRLIKKIPTDPWGAQYQYQLFGKDAKKPFAVYSFGLDRKKGGSDLAKDIYCVEDPE